ncbi:cadherin domain-containing protein [Rufibacter immobilis]|uniref:cadherin domain-containing protein n=1 Tax=Rufibacter immobilis TaxID=1348778 RepID=UPI0035EEE27F
MDMMKMPLGEVWSFARKRISLSGSKLFTFLITLLLQATAFAQAGKNGELTVSTVNTVVNGYSALTPAGGGTGAVTLGAGSTTINHSGSTTFTPGDLVMIIQVQGGGLTMNTTITSSAYGTIASNSYGNVGRYELKIVNNVLSATQFTINQATTVAFTSTDLTGTGNNNRAQIVKIPRYTSLTVNTGASIVPAAWNGRTGGIVALEVSGITTINGTISANGFGFRGGQVQHDSNPTVPQTNPEYAYTDRTRGAAKGESIAGSTTFNATTFAITGTLPGGAIFGRGAPANGGGGGGNSHNGGGGGGSNGDNTRTWTGQGVMCSNCTGAAIWAQDPGYTSNNNTRTNSSGGGRGGYTYSANNQNASTTANGPGNTAWGGDNRKERGGLGGHELMNIAAQSRLFFGGGGGAGDSNDGYGTSGGNGGGLVYLISNALVGSGTISANGATAANAGAGANATGQDAPGGGGGGGSIIVETISTLPSTLRLDANGGAGGNQNIVGMQNEAEGPGGGGGGGYIGYAGGTPNLSVNGGTNGTTNSPGLTEFPANGATIGATGQTADIANTTMPNAGLDLSIAQVVTTGPYYRGQEITITLSASNNSATAATNVTVEDLLPAGLVYVRHSTSSGTYNSAIGLWNIGSLTANTTSTLAITAIINDNNSMNTAEISGNQYDSNGTNNRASVTVTPVNQPPMITSNGGGATASIDLPENSTAATTVTSTDPENNTRTYSITGGADAAKFSINTTTGVLAFITAPNFEIPTDVDANNTYLVTVRATDNGTGALFEEQTITINVTNVNEAPVITSNGGGAAATISFPENSTAAVTTVTATDVDAGSALIYSILSSGDADKFNLNATTGLLTFKIAPNFEAPTDTDRNNTYVVTVRVTDNGAPTGTRDQVLTVNVTNVNEAPTAPTDINSATNTVAENAANGTQVGITASSTDVDANTSLTYSLTNNANGLFTISPSTGVVSVANASLLDYETATSHSITVRAYDGALYSSTSNFTITVTNVNEAPVITSNGAGATASISIAENTTSVTTATSIDPENSTRTYSISGGADVDKFSINAATGVLIFTSAPDFETPTDEDGNNSYLVTVRVTDSGSLFDEQIITVSVTNVNEAPVAFNQTNSATLLNTATATPLDAINGTDDLAVSTFRLTTLPASGTLTINGVTANTTTDYLWSSRNQIIFAPAVTSTADATFSYTVKDGAGLTNATPATFIIPINGEPVANNQTNSATLLTTADATLLDALNGTDDVSIVTFRLNALPASGALTINGAAANTTTNYAWSLRDKISFDPAAGYTTDVTFSYTVKDGEGAADATPALFTIPLNAAPVALNIRTQTLLNTAAASTLTINAYPTDDNDVMLLKFKFSSLPNSNQGNLTIGGIGVVAGRTYSATEAMSLRFDPAPTNLADVQLIFSVIDAEGAESNNATFTIPINGEPVAQNVTNATFLTNTAPATLLSPLEGNDGENPAGNPSYFQITTAPTSGTLFIDGNAVALNTNYPWSSRTKISFKPSVDYTGTVTFSYTVIDAENAKDATPATFSIPIVLDTDGDTVADANDLDNDNDGISDLLESNGINPFADADNDGVLNYRDSKFGILNSKGVVASLDKDGDGIINALDLDSDNDGITDALEQTGGILPANYDRLTGRLTRVGSSGTPQNSFTTLEDMDNDGIPNFLDIDADGDGIPDFIEAQAEGNTLKTSGVDANQDGIDDAYRSTGNISLVPIDNDGDTMPDFLDLDSDNDTIHDFIEAFDFNKNGVSSDDLAKLGAEFTSRAQGTSAKDFYPSSIAPGSKVQDWLKFATDTRFLFLNTKSIFYKDSDNDGLVDLLDVNSYGSETTPEMVNYGFRSSSTVVTLPVELISFTAKAKGANVQLHWSTATEKNNDYFQVERSTDGKSFTAIGKVTGNGNSNILQNYGFLDTSAPQGTSYYRLKQVDFDGQHEYTKTVVVNKAVMTEGLAQVGVSPNPFSQKLSFTVNSTQARTLTVDLHDLNGKLILHENVQVPVGESMLTRDLQTVAVGVYILRVKGPSINETIRVVKTN